MNLSNPGHKGREFPRLTPLQSNLVALSWGDLALTPPSSALLPSGTNICGSCVLGTGLGTQYNSVSSPSEVGALIIVIYRLRKLGTRGQTTRPGTPSYPLLTGSHVHVDAMCRQHSLKNQR